MQNALEQWSPEYISVGFVAKRCGVSNTTVLRWITTGQLPAFRLPGGHYRIERDDFSEFLTKHSIPVGTMRHETNDKNRGDRQQSKKRGAKGDDGINTLGQSG